MRIPRRIIKLKIGKISNSRDSFLSWKSWIQRREQCEHKRSCSSSHIFLRHSGGCIASKWNKLWMQIHRCHDTWELRPFLSPFRNERAREGGCGSTISRARMQESALRARFVTSIGGPTWHAIPHLSLIHTTTKHATYQSCVICWKRNGETLSNFFSVIHCTFA